MIKIKIISVHKKDQTHKINEFRIDWEDLKYLDNIDEFNHDMLSMIDKIDGIVEHPQYFHNAYTTISAFSSYPKESVETMYRALKIYWDNSKRSHQVNQDFFKYLDK